MPPLLWFAAALVPMVISQILRLQQTEAVWWVVCDMSGRIAALLTLVSIPAARKVAFAIVQPKIANWETAAWILSLFILTIFADQWIGQNSPSFFNARLGGYPVTSGPLRIFDLTAGLALVAFHEELIFRRCVGHVFDRYIGRGAALVVFSSILFGTYHWWKGIGGCVDAAVFGIGAMIFYLRSGALAPVILLHYIVDLRFFIARSY